MARGGKRTAPRELTPEEALEECASLLNAKVTDWDEIYLQVRSSAFGADYPPERFARTPIGHIKRIIAEISNQEQGNANLASSTTAQLCYLVRQAIHLYTQSTTPLTDIGPKNYLPFPEWKPPGSTPKGPSEITVQILREALRRREIPLYVFASLITPPEDDG